MKDEYHQQVATEGRAGRIGDCRAVPAGLQPSIQSKAIHPTAALRVPGNQDVFQNRLPGCHSHPERYAGPLSGYRSYENSAFHHAAKSGTEIDGFGRLQEAFGRNYSPGVGRATAD